MATMPVVKAENWMPHSGSTKYRKKSCTSSGVLRMNSVTMPTGQRTKRVGARKAMAQTRPRLKEISEPRTRAWSVTSTPSQKCGMKSATADQSQVPDAVVITRRHLPRWWERERSPSSDGC